MQCKATIKREIVEVLRWTPGALLADSYPGLDAPAQVWQVGAAWVTRVRFRHMVLHLKAQDMSKEDYTAENPIVNL